MDDVSGLPGCLQSSIILPFAMHTDIGIIDLHRWCMLFCFALVHTDVQPTVTQPNIVSQLVIVATSQLKRTSFQQGAYRESLFTGWMTANKMQDYIPTVLANEGWSQSYWGPIEMTGESVTFCLMTLLLRRSTKSWHN